jgi:arylsulfatase A
MLQRTIHVIIGVISLMFLTGTIEAQSRRPNIVIILADDLGYGDLGSFNRGSKIPTPHLDRLAREGLRLTDAHAPSTSCTPTRYGILTGRYPWRSRLKSGVLPPYGAPLIEADRLTLPAMLQRAGYATAAIGKWHLGWDWPSQNGEKPGVTPDGLSNIDYSKPLANGPITRGFDSFFGVDLPNFPPYVFIENDRTLGTPTEPIPANHPHINRKGPMSKDWDPMTILPRITERAVRYLASRAGDRQPFFLYFPLTSPHYPVVPTAEFQGKSGAGDYGDFVMQTDAAVGKLMEALDRHGLARNTLVVFTSDNGPEVASEVVIGAYDRIERFGHASMERWRGVKRDTREGGHRVPFIARWPERIAAGRVSDALFGQIDLMATIARLIGLQLPVGAAPDSIDQSALFLGKKLAKAARTEMVYHQSNGHLALRAGDWVFIDSPTCGDGNKEPAWFREARQLHPCTDPGALYDLRSDPGQARNLLTTHPERVQQMKNRLDQLRQAEGNGDR